MFDQILKDGRKMKKIVSVSLIVVFLFVLAPILPAFNTAGTPAGWGKTYKLSKLNKSEVKNLQGKMLGEIEDFVIDSQGRIPFVLLSHGEKIIVVPYSALAIEGNFLVLDVSEEKLASAPAVGEKEDSIDQAKAKEIYRYFGQTPYWTEEF